MPYITELVDCDKLDSGCNGGYPTWAYQELIRLGVLCCNCQLLLLFLL